jgi:hypothetical protein
MYVVSIHWGWFWMRIYVVSFHWGWFCMRMYAVSIGIYIYGIGFRSSMFMCISVAFYCVMSCPSLFPGVTRQLRSENGDTHHTRDAFWDRLDALHQTRLLRSLRQLARTRIARTWRICSLTYQQLQQQQQQQQMLQMQQDHSDDTRARRALLRPKKKAKAFDKRMTSMSQSHYRLLMSE